MKYILSLCFSKHAGVGILVARKTTLFVSLVFFTDNITPTIVALATGYNSSAMGRDLFLLTTCLYLFLAV